MIKGFAQDMETALQQAGAVARMLQGRVRNDGKYDDTKMPNDNELVRQKRAAKTLADEVVQEILLVAASSLLDKRVVAVDAEENTPSTEGFAAFGDPKGQSLIIDPIDGTLQYIAGSDVYSICVGLVRNGTMTTALVYFAEKDICYVLDKTGQSFVADNFSEHGWRYARNLHTVNHQGRRIYVNGRVDNDVLIRLRNHGYEVVEDIELFGGAPECIMSCFSGESLGYIAHTLQMRDLLLGAIVAGAPGGRALTWAGEPLIWPPRGRVDRAVFLGSELPDDLISCLASPE
jgi:fructose-1,6-bisphosphatase/inositol monophosphatase family enzyme